MTRARAEERIAFVGLSHLGLVSSVCWSSLEMSIVAVDSDADLISDLKAGRFPIHEPGLQELWDKSRERFPLLSAFESIQSCGTVVLSLDTGSGPDSHSALSKLDELVVKVIPQLADGTLLLLMSQVPTGYTRELKDTICASRPGLTFELFNWVETLVIGQAVERSLRPERVLLGCEHPDEALPQRLQSIVSHFACPVQVMSYESAELSKAAVNYFLALSVTFSNHMADLCEATGASMQDVIAVLRSDRRIGPHAYLRPSLGIAGGNIERDLSRLETASRENGVETGLVRCILDHNRDRYRWVHRQLSARVFPHASPPKIGVWGLAYKKNTQSTRNSFAVRVLHDLQGRAELRVYDPVAGLPGGFEGLAVERDALGVVEGADCLLVTCDWDEFVATDYAAVGRRMRRRLIIDCVGILKRAEARRNGFELIAMGEGRV
ncbi:MAG: UDP-glucose/GDP-mannose dehydrogenase family protein [Nitrospirae bacterium]|nr:UDP-glucose/GDP-mannose dehydrogenase family protein [Nitrospirota bacterium]